MDTIFNKLVDRINSALVTKQPPQLHPLQVPTATTTTADFIETGTELRDDEESSSSAHTTSPNGGDDLHSPPRLVPPRVLVLRSCTSRGRKILFDSYHVTDDGEYTRQTDAKFLKETVAEFAFGSVSIATNHTNRFTKFNHNNATHLIWANVFSTRPTTTPQQQQHSSSTLSLAAAAAEQQQQQRPLLSTSSSSSSSSSGYYSSLPLMTTSPGHKYKGTTLSLPSDSSSPLHPHSRTYYLSCVIILTTTPTSSLLLSPALLSSPLESALATLKSLTLKTYTRLKTFPVTLKSFANSLHLDLSNLLSHTHLKSITSSLTTQIASHPTTPELIATLIANPNAHVVIATRKVDQSYHKFESFFTIAHTIHKFLNNKQRRRHCHHGDDSGVNLNGSSSYSNQSSFNNPLSANSLYSLNSNSSEEEREEDVPQETTMTSSSSKGFYLGEEEDDPEEHQEFALGDVDINKLYHKQRNTVVVLSPHDNNKQQQPLLTTPIIIAVPLDLPPPPPTTNNKAHPHNNDDDDESLPSYYINTSRRYVPFHRYQVILSPSPPTYDASHLLLQTHTPIIEINPDSSPPSIRTFNTTANSSHHSLDQQIRTLLEKTSHLSSTLSPQSAHLFFTINLTQQILNKLP